MGTAVALPDSGRLSSQLRASVSADPELAAFYEARDHRPLWVEGSALRPEAAQLVEIIEKSDQDGLDPAQYDIDKLRAAVAAMQPAAPSTLAEAELMLSRAFARYVHDLHRPKDGVGMIFIDREIMPQPPAARESLEAAAAAPSLSEHLAEARRMNPLYEQLRDGLAAYRERWGNLPEIEVPAGPTLALGAEGERVRTLRRRLGLAEGTRFDMALANAVGGFDAAHGLAEDGAADGATLAALNRGFDHYEGLILANLERARALPADPGERYILVDAAAARLWLYEEGRARDTMKVVVGKPQEQTPMMAGLIRFTTLNPYWNIPPDLVQKRVAPAVLQDGFGHLTRKRFEALSGWSEDARVLKAQEVDWKAVASGKQMLRMRQLPGEGNMMGDMKFMFPNRYGIYLHDTPDKSLFGLAERRLSSGCVRVEDAARLARWLYGREVSARGGPEQRLDLPEPVPVYITYLTAAPTPQGITFREDFYGRDARLLARLESGRKARAA